MVEVRIYVEGGGDNNHTKGRLREGFVKYFDRLLTKHNKPKVIACGSRNCAFDAWKTAIAEHKYAFCILLVDSEDPVVANMSPWQHLKKRDKWDKPRQAVEEHCHLMTQCMEAWFIADRQALAAYYQQGFNEKALPQQSDIEAIPKADLFKKLAAATRKAKKGEYGKGTHGPELMAIIDPMKVESAAPAMARLAKVLRTKLRGKRDLTKSR